MANIFDYVPHPHIARRNKQGPPTVAAAVTQVHGDSQIGKLNAKIGLAITNAVGTMWTAYVFTVLSLLSLPYVLSLFKAFHGVFPAWMIRASILTLIAWIAQTFLQLVLLPIIIVGQNVQAAAADARSQATYDDAAAVLEESKQIQAHLLAQDDHLEKILSAVATSGSKS